VNKFRNQREGVFVQDGPFVQVPVILNRSVLAVFLFDKEEAAGIWQVGVADLV